MPLFLAGTVSAQPAENLVLENIPAIPAASMPGLSPYQDVRSAAFLDWLPAKGGMLISTRFGDTAQVHQVSAAGGRRTQLTFQHERISWALACPRKDCPYLVFGMDRGGSETYQIYRRDLDSGRVTLLTDGKSRYLNVIWNRAGTQLAYATTERDGRNFDIYLMDPMRPAQRQLVAKTKGRWSPLSFGPGDKSLLLQHYVSITRSSLHLLNFKSGKMRELTLAGPQGNSNPQAKFSPDGKTIYLTTDAGGEFVRLAALATRAPKFRPRTLADALAWNVHKFDLSADGKWLALVINEGGFSRLRLQKVRGKGKRSPQIPAGVITQLRFDPAGDRLAFTLVSNQLPGDVFVYDLLKNTTRRWTFSETGGLDVAHFVEPKIVHFPTFDQVAGKPREIPALLYLPPAKFKPPYPVLVSIHGGPEGQARPYFLARNNYILNEMGVAMVRPNVRGSDGYGRSYLGLDNDRQREDTVRDIGALLDWIAQRKDLDQNRVAVSGGSYGGYMSLATMVHYSERLRCGIDYVGISNFVTFLKNTKDYRRDLRRVEYGDERIPAMHDFLQRISPLSSVERISVPLLVVQGANDPRVPASEAEQIVRKVQQGKREVWYLLAKDEGHGFRKKKNKDFMNRVRIRFLQTHLLAP